MREGVRREGERDGVRRDGVEGGHGGMVCEGKMSREGMRRDGVWRWCGVVGWYVVGRGR